MNAKMILIVGRTCTGKDTLVHKLEKEGYKVVKSYTTRPRRFEGEDTHIFISSEEAAAITDKVATTVLNGYEYFATHQQVINSDIYIIDPRGLWELTRNCPDIEFLVVSVTADTDLARVEAINRSHNADEEKIFNSRCASEDAQFTEFENQISKTDRLSENCSVIYRYHNTFKWSDLEDAVIKIKEAIT